VSDVFLHRYQEHIPIDPGFVERILLYNLHTMLIHVWLFGDDQYVESARTLARRVARWLEL
jgi:fructosamine-3-kinase